MQHYFHPPPPHMPNYARGRQLVQSVLAENPNGLTVKDVCRLTGLTTRPVHHALEHLTDQGMLVRERADHLCRKPFVYRMREVTQ